MTRRWAIASLAFVVLRPLAALAEPLEIPQLGIRIANLPSGEIKAQVTRRVDGYEATLHLGTGVLTLARLDDPVPPGTSIGDAGYRKIQQADFHEDLGPDVFEQAATVAGHDAWTRFSAHRWTSVVPQGLADDSIRYTDVTYVIVDEHLYRLVAVADGGVMRPPDFEAAVHAMSGLTFVALERAADTAPAPSGLLKMPKWGWAANLVWYPPPAVRRREEGVVDLEFSIDGKGHVRDALQTFAVSDTLAKAAKALLQNITYQVNPSWDAQGYQSLRFNLEVQFWLIHIEARCASRAPPRLPAAQTIVICSPTLK